METPLGSGSLRLRTSPALIAASLLGAASSFFLALALATLVQPLAPRLGHVDRPGPRKRHERPVPLGGGIAIFFAIALPMGAAVLVAKGAVRAVPGLGRGSKLGVELAADAGALTVFLVAALVIHLAGVWDDQRALSPWAKLSVQIIAAAPLVTAFGVGVLPQWLDPIPSAIVAILWIVAVTNAFNFLDGTDGLAATVGALCAAMFLVSAFLSGQAAEAFLFSLLIGALVAFLLFNFPPAKLFMGDGGSQVVGFVLGFCSLRLTYFDAGWTLESPWYAVFTPLVVLAIPLYDLVTVIALRLVQRRNPFLGDDQHFIHRLSRRGLGARGVLVLVGACTVATGIGGVMLSRLEAWQAVLVVLQTMMILIVLALLEIHLAGRSGIVSEDDRAVPATTTEASRSTRGRGAAP